MLKPPIRSGQLSALTSSQSTRPAQNGPRDHCAGRLFLRFPEIRVERGKELPPTALKLSRIIPGSTTPTMQSKAPDCDLGVEFESLRARQRAPERDTPRGGVDCRAVPVCATTCYGFSVARRWHAEPA
jgi:hypothetical protein